MKKIKFLMPIATIAAIAPMATMVACNKDSLENIKGYTAKCAQFVPEAGAKYDTQAATKAYFTQANIKEIIKDDIYSGIYSYLTYEASSTQTVVDYAKAKVNIEKIEEKTVDNVTVYGITGQIRYEYKYSWVEEGITYTDTTTVNAKINQLPFEMYCDHEQSEDGIWTLRMSKALIDTSEGMGAKYKNFFDNWSLDSTITDLQIDQTGHSKYGDTYINKNNKNKLDELDRVTFYLGAPSNNFANVIGK